VILNVDQYPGDLLVREFGSRMVCTKCGMVGADVRPNGRSGSGDKARRIAVNIARLPGESYQTHEP
jgi:hypothetical protein